MVLWWSSSQEVCEWQNVAVFFHFARKFGKKISFLFSTFLFWTCFSFFDDPSSKVHYSRLCVVGLTERMSDVQKRQTLVLPPVSSIVGSMAFRALSCSAPIAQIHAPPRIRYSILENGACTAVIVLHVVSVCHEIATGPLGRLQHKILCW